MALPRRLLQKGVRLGFAAALVAGMTAVGTAANAAPGEGTIVNAGGVTAVSESYIVVFNDVAVQSAQVSTSAQNLVSRFGGSVARTYQHALRGFEARMTEAAARRLAADPMVAYVEQNHTVSLAATQTPVPSWGIDRIDQRALPLNNSFTYPNNASNVRAYIIDTGIRTTHVTFGGRAIWGTNTTGDGNNTDCNGHGTHVAGTVGGAEYGVAKGVSLTAVKVLNCAGSGTFAGVIAGIDWVTGDHDPGELAVANMSLGGGFDQSVNDAVTRSIADGVTYALAAGNSSADACTSSPASTPNAITVGSTESNDARSSFSNFGTCLDIFAPGGGITSSWNTNDTATNTISGTSMASPHVAGVAALIQSANPSFTPLQVRNKMVDTDATNGVVTNPGTGSPNKLLFVDNGGAGGVSVSNPGSQTSTVGTAISPVNHTASGGTAPYTWSATGLPPGLSINASTGSITGTPTAAGSFSVTVTARDSGTPQQAGSTAYGWTVNSPPTPGCSATNGADVAIPDLSTVDSLITIAGCAGNAGANATVEVHIIHTYIGDLVVSLVAPDGSAYVLHNRAGGATDNINQTFTVNLSSEVANGTWRLRVQDAAAADVGTIDSWTLNLSGGGGPGPCTGTNGTDVAIPDLSTVQSTIAIAGCTGNASATSTVQVNIIHTFIGDLVVTLVAPDGSAYVLHNRAGGAADNINQTFTVNLSSEVRNGTWILRVQDAAAADVGTIDSWTLNL